MFVRGISKVSVIDTIMDDCEQTQIGVVYKEMRTSDDKLSVWKIEDIADLNDAALSIVLPRKHIDDAAFLVMEEDALEEYNVSLAPEEPEKVYINNSKAEHYNMTNVRICSAANILRVYKKMAEREKSYNTEHFIVSWSPRQAAEKILEAYNEGRIVMSNLDEQMKNSILKHKEKEIRN